MYETDKLKHGLLSQYDEIFCREKNERLKILEVGVFRGGSLLWMADYFKNSEIFGIDIALPEISHPRVKMKICDQKDSIGLERMAMEWGKFDVIIDDGCHHKEETKNTFNSLFKHLKPGGLYIIEDFIASYWDEYPQYKGLNDLVFEIAARKNELGIGAFLIKLEDPKMSFACFYKK